MLLIPIVVSSQYNFTFIKHIVFQPGQKLKRNNRMSLFERLGINMDWQSLRGFSPLGPSLVTSWPDPGRSTYALLIVLSLLSYVNFYITVSPSSLSFSMRSLSTFSLYFVFLRFLSNFYIHVLILLFLCTFSIYFLTIFFIFLFLTLFYFPFFFSLFHSSLYHSIFSSFSFVTSSYFLTLLSHPFLYPFLTVYSQLNSCLNKDI